LVYAMNSRSHRRYALVFVALGVLIGVAYVAHAPALALALDAALTIVAVFYLTSFLRGAHEEA
jgi:hypothetical protein